MRPAQDCLTLLQLAVGMNLVIGAYGSHGKGIEGKIESELDLHREKIDEIISTEHNDNSPISEGLEKKG